MPMIANTTRLPNEAGAYALIITLDQNIRFMTGVLGEVELPGGCYVYAGSARGPGGIGTRVARHLKKEKTQRWHIDFLTNAAKSTHPIAFAGGHECGIVSSLAAADGFIFPVLGFGSSDCRICPSHLLLAPNPEAAARALHHPG